MTIVMYTADDCPVCVRVFSYLFHLSGGTPITTHDAAFIDRIPDSRRRATVRTDLAWQDDRLPLVYIDGRYQELDELLKKVAAHEIAQRNDIGRCHKEFLFT